MKSNQTIEVPSVTYNDLLELDKEYTLLKKKHKKSLKNLRGIKKVNELRAKEFEEFHKWYLDYSHEGNISDRTLSFMEDAWLGRAKLTEKQDIASIPKDRRIIGINSYGQSIVHWDYEEGSWCGDQYGLHKNPVDEPLYWQELPRADL